MLFYVLFIYPQFVTPGAMLRMSDFVLPNVNNQTNFNLSFYSWSTYGLGQPSIPSLSMGLIYVLTKWFGAWVAQQFFGFASMLVASTGMYLFLVRTGWVRSRVWAAVVSILYVVNWAVFSYEGDNAALLTITGIMWTYAMIPFVMLCGFRIFVQGRFSVYYVVCLGVASFVASLSNSQALVIMAGVMIPFVLYYVLEKILFVNGDPSKAIFRLITTLVGWGALCCLLVFPVVLSLVSSILLTGNVQSLYGVKAALTPHPGIYHSVYVYPISALLVLSSPREFTNVYELLGLAVPVLCVFGVLIENDRQKKLLGLLFFSLVLLITGWILLIIILPGGIAKIYAIPVLGQLLQVVRSPLKFFMFLAPFLTVLLALGITNVAPQKRSGFGGGLGGLLILCAMIAVFMNHDGRVFSLRGTYVEPTVTRSAQGGEHGLPYGRLNNSLVQITHDLQAASGPAGRVLWLPNENDIWLQTTQISFENILSYPSSLTMGIYQKEIADAFADGTPTVLAKLLTLLRVRHLVIIKYSKQTGPPRIWGTPPWGEHIVGDPIAFLSFLDNQPAFKKVKEDDSYAIYENALFQ